MSAASTTGRFKALTSFPVHRPSRILDASTTAHKVVQGQTFVIMPHHYYPTGILLGSKLPGPLNDLIYIQCEASLEFNNLYFDETILSWLYAYGYTLRLLEVNIFLQFFHFNLRANRFFVLAFYWNRVNMPHVILSVKKHHTYIINMKVKCWT